MAFTYITQASGWSLTGDHFGSDVSTTRTWQVTKSGGVSGADYAVYAEDGTYVNGVAAGSQSSPYSFGVGAGPTTTKLAARIIVSYGGTTYIDAVWDDADLDIIVHHADAGYKLLEHHFGEDNSYPAVWNWTETYGAGQVQYWSLWGEDGRIVNQLYNTTPANPYQYAWSGLGAAAVAGYYPKITRTKNLTTGGVTTLFDAEWAQANTGDNLCGDALAVVYWDWSDPSGRGTYADNTQMFYCRDLSGFERTARFTHAEGYLDGSAQNSVYTVLADNSVHFQPSRWFVSPLFAAPASWTLTVEAKMAVANVRQDLVGSVGAVTNDCIYLGIDATNHVVVKTENTANTTFTATSSTTIDPTAYHDYFVSRSGSVLSVSVDGTEVASVAVTGTPRTDDMVLAMNNCADGSYSRESWIRSVKLFSEADHIEGASTTHNPVVEGVSLVVGEAIVSQLPHGGGDPGGGGDGGTTVTPGPDPTTGDPGDPDVTITPDPPGPGPTPPGGDTPWIGYTGFACEKGVALPSAATPTAQNITSPVYSATNLPPGLSIATNGNITGTPTRVGVYWVRVSATGTGDVTAVTTFRITVFTQPSPPPLPDGTTASPYVRQIGDTFQWVVNGVVYYMWRMPSQLWELLNTSTGYLGWWNFTNPNDGAVVEDTPNFADYTVVRLRQFRRNEARKGGLSRWLSRWQAVALTFPTATTAVASDMVADGETISHGETRFVRPDKAYAIWNSGLAHLLDPDATEQPASDGSDVL